MGVSIVACRPLVWASMVAAARARGLDLPAGLPDLPDLIPGFPGSGPLVLADSVSVPCADCGTQVELTPAQQDVVTSGLDPEPRVLCFLCAAMTLAGADSVTLSVRFVNLGEEGDSGS